MTTDKKLVRLAGLFYLIVAVTGGFGELVVCRSLIEAGDTVATVDNRRGSGTGIRRWSTRD